MQKICTYQMNIPHYLINASLLDNSTAKSINEPIKRKNNINSQIPIVVDPIYSIFVYIYILQLI